MGKVGITCYVRLAFPYLTLLYLTEPKEPISLDPIGVTLYHMCFTRNFRNRSDQAVKAKQVCTSILPYFPFRLIFVDLFLPSPKFFSNNERQYERKRTYVHLFILFLSKSLIIFQQIILALHFQRIFGKIFKGFYVLAKQLHLTPSPL